MLSKPMEQALNKQINEELFSAYLYLAMTAYFEQANYRGMASWMKVQFKEETIHALKIFDYVHERGGVAKLLAIEQPKANWTTPLAAFAAALTHERSITKKIYALVDKAAEEKDHGTANFLQWFVKEQVEEEASVEPIMKQLEAIGDHLGALYHLDHQLGKRQ
jgi:ferritin